MAAALLVAALAAAPVAAKPGPHPAGGPKKVYVVGPSALFCPGRALLFGSIVISAGRCYTVLLLRDGRGTFLAFAAPRAIPPGQLVRLGTPAGAKVRGRIFYLVPIRTTRALIPVGTVRVVAVEVQDFGPRMLFVLQGFPSIIVTFMVRL